MSITLCPTQNKAFAELERLLPLGSTFVLYGESGSGKSAILRTLHQIHGGAMLTMRDFVDAMRPQHPLALEETFEAMVLSALQTNAVVFVDDLHLLAAVVSYAHTYPRSDFINASLTTLCIYAEEAQKKLIFACAQMNTVPLYQRGLPVTMKEFTPEDYTTLFEAFLPAHTRTQLDYTKIHRFAPNLNAHQIKNACLRLNPQAELETQAVIDFLREHQMMSNVNLDDVQNVDLHSLKGVDDVLESLEANLIVPLEHDDLAGELGLQPKRGVLLLGPPGTGKTTIGRALAHRLKSKFFLIDGTFISGSSDFYMRIHQIFEAARHNAPCIIFIDDCDAIFESGEELGLYRYLLTMLDGLESQSIGRVCVMLTAMDVSHLPPALVRSGRIELWLEMHLPDEAARGAILTDHLKTLPEALATADVKRLVSATKEFTGADLKRLIEDGKTLYAYDKVRGRTLRSATEYFLEAVETVQDNKQRYAAAEEQTRRQKPGRPIGYALPTHNT